MTTRGGNFSKMNIQEKKRVRKHSPWVRRVQVGDTPIQRKGHTKSRETTLFPSMGASEVKNYEVKGRGVAENAKK